MTLLALILLISVIISKASYLSGLHISFHSSDKDENVVMEI